MCRNRIRLNPYKNGWRLSLSALLFMEYPDGPINYQSWFTHLLIYRSPLSFIEIFFAAPSGINTAYFMWQMELIVREVTTNVVLLYNFRLVRLH